MLDRYDCPRTDEPDPSERAIDLAQEIAQELCAPDARLPAALADLGLVIVEAGEYDRMRTTLQLIGSCVTEINGIPTALEAMAQAARNALAKGS